MTKKVVKLELGQNLQILTKITKWAQLPSLGQEIRHEVMQKINFTLNPILGNHNKLNCVLGLTIPSRAGDTSYLAPIYDQIIIYFYKLMKSYKENES